MSHVRLGFANRYKQKGTGLKTTIPDVKKATKWRKDIEKQLEFFLTTDFIFSIIFKLFHVHLFVQTDTRPYIRPYAFVQTDVLFAFLHGLCSEY